MPRTENHNSDTSLCAPVHSLRTFESDGQEQWQWQMDNSGQSTKTSSTADLPDWQRRRARGGRLPGLLCAAAVRPKGGHECPAVLARWRHPVQRRQRRHTGCLAATLARGGGGQRRPGRRPAARFPVMLGAGLVQHHVCSDVYKSFKQASTCGTSKCMCPDTRQGETAWAAFGGSMGCKGWVLRRQAGMKH